MNASTAPRAIRPSTPRLRTPARSTTSSPRAARRKGVAAASMPARMNSIAFMAGSDEADEGDGDEIGKQQAALENANCGDRQVRRHHGVVATNVERGHKQGGEDDPN